jgi:CIC family chloride channel protein
VDRVDSSARKIIATSLSIGTGGSGGIFGQGVVIGGFVGAAVWRLGDLFDLPGIPDGPAVFVVGTMVCFGSVAHAPLAVIMVAEMTGSFSVIPCAMVAVSVAHILITRTQVSIYQAQPLIRETTAALLSRLFLCERLCRLLERFCRIGR